MLLIDWAQPQFLSQTDSGSNSGDDSLQELQIILLMVLLRKEVKDLLVRTKMATVKAVHHRTKMEVVIARQIMNLFEAAKILQTNWLQVWASFMLDHQKLIMAGMKIQSFAIVAVGCQRNSMVAAATVMAVNQIVILLESNENRT